MIKVNIIRRKMSLDLSRKTQEVKNLCINCKRAETRATRASYALSVWGELVYFYFYRACFYLAFVFCFCFSLSSYFFSVSSPIYLAPFSFIFCFLNYSCLVFCVLHIFFFVFLRFFFFIFAVSILLFLFPYLILTSNFPSCRFFMSSILQQWILIATQSSLWETNNYEKKKIKKKYDGFAIP